MPVNTIQPTFAGGEFSPNLQVRVDLEKYASGLKTCRNFFVHPDGGASNRPGFKMIASTKYLWPTRLLPFTFSTGQSYVIEFGHQYCRFYKDGGQIQAVSHETYNAVHVYNVGEYVTSSGIVYTSLKNSNSGHTPASNPTWWAVVTLPTPYEIITPYAVQDLSNIRIVQSADVLFIACAGYQPMELSRLDHAHWRLSPLNSILDNSLGKVAFQAYVQDYCKTNGPFLLSNTLTTATIAASNVAGLVTLTASINTFDPLHVGAFWKLRHHVNGQSLTPDPEVYLSNVNPSRSLACGSTWRLIVNNKTDWIGTISVQILQPDGSYFTVRSFGNLTTPAPYIDIYGTVDFPTVVRVVQDFSVGGSVGALIKLSTDGWEQAGVVQITAVASPTTATATVIEQLGSTVATYDWAEGAWSGYRGFPSVVAFFQDRLCFANTKSNPQTVWMSKSGSYRDFNTSTPLLDTDAISINLPSREVNEIHDLVPMGDLIALTSNAEWSIGATNSSNLSLTVAEARAGAAITPMSVEVRVQTHRGSHPVSPVVVGGKCVYLQRFSDAVRDLGFDLQQQGYAGEDLAVFSKHMFENHSVLEMAYQQDPFSIVWCVREDGKLIAMTYVKEQQVLAWHRHDTLGVFRSVCTIPGALYTELWAVVSRSGQQFVERMVNRMESEDVKDQFFLDCGLSYDNPIGVINASKVLNLVQLQLDGIPSLVVGDQIYLSEFHWADVVNSDGELVQPDILNGRVYTVSFVSGFMIRLAGTEAIDVTGYVWETGKYRKLVSTVTGLTHLNGRSVVALADGNVIKNLTVSGGAITLPAPAAIVHVGLPYVADLETLNIELKLQSGTIQGKRVKIPEAVLKLKDWRGGFIGQDKNNLAEITEYENFGMGEVIPLQTKDHRETLPSEYQDSGNIFFRQTDPLPVTILAIVPKVVPGGP